MRRTFNNLKIKTLSLALCVALLVIGVGIVSASIMTARDVDGIGQTWTKFDKVVAAKSAILGQMRGALGYGGMIHQFKNYVLRQDKPRIAKTYAKIAEAKAAMTAYRALGINAKEDSAINDIAGVVALYADAVATSERMTGEGAGSTDIDKAVKISDKPALAGMATLDAELRQARQASAGAVYDAVAKVSAESETVVAAVALTFVALIGIFFWFISLRLARPLAGIAEVIDKLAGGHRDVVIPAVERGDELGDMARSLESIRDAGVKIYKLEQMVERLPLNVMTCDPKNFVIDYMNEPSLEVLRTLEDHLPVKADKIVGQSFDIFHKNPEHQRRIIGDPANLPYKAKFVLGGESIALRAVAITDREGAYMGPMVTWTVITEQQKIIDNFESNVLGVVESVASGATQLQSTAESVAAASEESGRQSATVASASEEASSNVQTVAAAAEEMSTSIEEIGRQVTMSNEISTRAVEEADKTNVSVEGLAEAASKIGEVVNLISDIAEQTNLLALNATIEAARAGDAGKGFAVVASEVKSLADQTAKATEEIESQIGAMQSSTAGAVDAIKGIGTTIGEISEIAAAIASAVEQQGAATQEIARNVQEAAKGTQEVTSNISGIQKAAQESGQSSAQVLEASGNLSNQSEILRGEVGTFLDEMKRAL